MLSPEYRGVIAADSPYRTDVLTAQDILAETAAGSDISPGFVTTNVDGLNPTPYGNVPVIAPLSRKGGRTRNFGYTQLGRQACDPQWRLDSDMSWVQTQEDNGIVTRSAIRITPDETLRPASRHSPTAILPGASGSNTENIPRAQFFQVFNNEGFLFWVIVALVGYLVLRGYTL